MDLIERYVSAVGRRLPNKGRRDIETELKSLIMDALEAKCPAGQSPLEDDIVAVLEELGPPQVVAARYAPAPQQLIGPQLFDTYLLVLGIVLGVTVLGLTIATVIDLTVNAVPLISGFARLMTTLFSGAITAFGYVTIIFAVIERVMPDGEKASMACASGKWDPRKLPPAISADSVKTGDSVAGICFTVLAVVVFNLFASRLGMYYTDGSGWQYVQTVNTAAIARFLPYWNVLWAASIVHNVFLLARRQWTVGSRVFSIGIGAGSVIILGFMATTSFIDIQAFQSMGGSASPEDLLKLGRMVTGLIRGGIILAMIGTVVDMVTQVIGIVKMAGRQ